MAKHHDRTGRTKGEGKYVQVHDYVLLSFAWSQLSLAARCAWIEFARLYNGSNNGKLAMSSRRLGERMNICKSSAAKAINELITYGFLEIARASDFSKKREAAEYRLTHLACDVSRKPASRQFMRVGQPPDTARSPDKTLSQITV